MSIASNEAPTDEDLIDFLAAASDDTGDLLVITEKPIEIAKRYYTPDNRPVLWDEPQNAA